MAVLLLIILRNKKMSKIKDFIMEAEEMGITEGMMGYFAIKYLFNKETQTGSKVFERIVKELGEY
jgi:hypothetical protein